MSKYVYGIDLGTTYSCIAYQDENGMPVVVRNEEGAETTPSVISLAEEEPVVGQVAKDNAVFDADYTLSLVKNQIGRKDENGDPVMIYYGPDAENEISPTTASSYTLKKLARDAGRELDDTVTKVVITCPAYFNAEQRAQTKQAGIEAGLEVLSVIDEPTAAALCYGCSRDVEGQTFLVYDLGGGTFDITVMRVENGVFTVVCSEGNHDLGGALWDRAIYDYAEEKYREANPNDEEEFEIDTMQELTIKSERAKIELTQKQKTIIPIITPNGKAKVELTLDTFDELTSTLIEETIALTKKAIAVAQGFAMKMENGEKREKTLDEILAEFGDSYNPEGIDQILLVGGSTRMKQVERRVTEEFKLPIKQFDPDQAVAKGAAIFASMEIPIPVSEPAEDGDGTAESSAEADGSVDMIQSKPPANFASNMIGGKPMIQTICNKSYGIVVTRVDNDNQEGREVINNLIMRDTNLPYSSKETYQLSSDDQSSIWIRLCEGLTRDEYYDYDENCLIFDAVYPIPKGLAKTTPVEIEMSLQQDGTLDINIEIAGQKMTGQHTIDME